MVVTLVGLMSAGLCIPFVRSLFWLGDEGILLHGAARLLDGKEIYKDFFSYLPPGSFIIVALWFDVFGTSIFAARILAMITISAISCLIFSTCRRVTNHAPSAAFMALAWVVVSQGSLTQVNHHWFTTLLTMVMAWATLRDTGPPKTGQGWPVIAGLAAGMAIMVTPTRGALPAMAVLASHLCHGGNWGKTFQFVISGAIVPLSMLIYMMRNGILGDRIEDFIVFNLTNYTAIQPVPFGFGTDPQNLLLLFAWPFAFFLTLGICMRGLRQGIQIPFIWPCALFSLAGFVGCYPRPDIVHIAFAAPLGFPLLGLAVQHTIGKWRLGYRSAIANVGLLCGALPPISYIVILKIALHGPVMETPRGAVALVINPEAVGNLIVWAQQTPRDDGFFFYPYLPMLPFLTDRHHVARYDIFVPGYTTPAQYLEACVAVLRHATWVIIDRRSADPGFLKAAFPAMHDAAPPETRHFEQALDIGFTMVARYGPFEVRRRGDQADAAICDSIAR